MGVPKFYRWISERYPCLSQVVKEYQIPEFDNLYLDMNGIIHTCSHPNDEDPHFRITEEQIFKDIFHYIEFLFRMIKPRKVFFMAVDGVAPRAKMNQQRGRRFRSAKEAEELEKKARERGEILPSEARFDSNCITPGTEFMAKLHELLKYFVTMKVSTDEMWQGVDIYLSGHETPGEGEHKIMDFIRYQRSQEGYDPNTRHCLYGLDADLIMLGLCSHEPHFALLREEVKFGGRKKDKNRIVTPEQTTFHLLHLSLMRDYLDHEFSSLKSTLPFTYDLEKIIDDWVLMGFLVGNDFIPHLPHFHIQHDALPLLHKVYIECLPSLGGYINEGGHLNLERFEKYVKKLSQIDYDKFNDTYADLKYFQSKTGRRMGTRKGPGLNKSRNDSLCADLDKLEESFKSRKNNSKPVECNLIDLLSPSNHTMSNAEYDNDDDDMYEDIGTDDEDEEEEEEEEEEDDDDDLFELEFRQHKRDYYMNKLDYANVTPEVMKDQAYGYVRAIQWNLHYYYNGVVSWSWYYPHHYAPYISDVKDFCGIKLDFDSGKPLLPFQQLLAVLPAASKQLLPSVYQSLVSDESSPLKEYYPLDFKTDLNGKTQEWEAVVLIPFIEEGHLLDAVRPLDNALSPDEKARNKHGPHLLYTYSEEQLDPYQSPCSCFPDIHHNHALCKEINQDFFRLPAESIKKGLLEGINLNVYFPGFPTLKHILHTAQLKNEKVRVFQMVSRGENMILTITDLSDQDIEEVAKQYLGKEVYINWPHLEEAKVLEVSDGDMRYYIEDDDKKSRTSISSVSMKGIEQYTWRKEAISIKERYLERFGIVIGDIDILVLAVPLLGRKYIPGVGGKMTLEKQYSSHSVTVALQTVVKDISVHSPLYHQFKTVGEIYPVGSKCFMLGNPHYGCMGEVLEVQADGQVRAKFSVLTEPKLKTVIKNQRELASERYMQGYIAAQKLGISGYLLSRITGSFFIQTGNPESMNPGRVNIGLNLRFNGKNEEVPGYTKKVDDMWLYSEKTIEIVNEYVNRFPDLFHNIHRRIRDDMIHVDDVFLGENPKEALQEVVQWLKTLPCAQAERQKCGALLLDETVVKAIEQAIIKNQEETNGKMQVMTVKPHLLYRPFHCHGNLPPDPGATFHLFDRVVNVRDGFSVPLGLRGTAIGICAGEKKTDLMLNVVFDEEFPGGLALRCSPLKGYQLPSWALLNITYGSRQMQKIQPIIPKKVVVKPIMPNNAIQPGQKNIFPSNGPRNAKDGSKDPYVGSIDSGYSSSYLDPNINWSGSRYCPPNVPAQSGVQSQFAHVHPPENSSCRWMSPPCNASQSMGSRTSGFNHSPNSPFVEKQQQDEFSSISEGLKYLKLQSQSSQPQVQSQSQQQNYPISQSSVPFVGKPVPVEELFREARKAEMKQAPPLYKNVPVMPVPPQGKPVECYNATTLGFSPPVPQARAIDVLYQHCTKNMHGTPSYEYSQLGPMHLVKGAGSKRLFQAKVVLPNGKTFLSIQKPSQQEASEDAAQTALAALGIKFTSQNIRGPVAIVNPSLPPFNLAAAAPPVKHQPVNQPQKKVSPLRQSPIFEPFVHIPESYLRQNRQLLHESNLSSKDGLLNSVDGVVQPSPVRASCDKSGSSWQQGLPSQSSMQALEDRHQASRKSREQGSGRSPRREWTRSDLLDWRQPAPKADQAWIDDIDEVEYMAGSSKNASHCNSNNNGGRKGPRNWQPESPRKSEKGQHNQEQQNHVNSKNNPFIPLQVIQKQKNPQSASNGRGGSQHQTMAFETRGRNENFVGQHSRGRGGFRDTPHNQHTSENSQLKDGGESGVGKWNGAQPNSQGSKNNRRSRLAAKFKNPLGN